ncbi:MAG: DUF86 domain-containing protein [Sedimentisphaerales bacterium]|nr:DUF86 domain-containing protein [Sedimentisphaerales bacterium]
MKDDRTYLLHILEAIEKIEKYIESVGFDEFSQNDMMIDAVVREFEIIGEASRNLSDKFQEEHSEIPWYKIKAMRNVLIHEYFGVNLKVVWDTCKSDMPVLTTFIKKQV